MNYFSRSFLIAFGFLSAVALAAAGDRFISNPNNNADTYIQVNKAGVTTNALKAVGSTGAVEIGSSGSTATHTVNGNSVTVQGTGNLTSGLNLYTSTTGASDRFQINIGNASAGNNGFLAHYTGTTKYTELGTNGYSFPVLLNGTNISSTTAGAWVIGATSNTQTQQIRGPLQTTSKTFSAYQTTNVTANQNIDFTSMVVSAGVSYLVNVAANRSGASTMETWIIDRANQASIGTCSATQLGGGQSTGSDQIGAVSCVNNGADTIIRVASTNQSGSNCSFDIGFVRLSL